MRPVALVLALLLGGCSLFPRPDAPGAPATAEAPRSPGMVSAANPLAVEAGLRVLREGGTAADAARIMGRAPVLPDGRRIGNGFRDALWPDAPTLAVLDAATGDIPTYLINADVHSVWLNSAALRREGFTTGDGTGMLRNWIPLFPRPPSSRKSTSNSKSR